MSWPPNAAPATTTRRELGARGVDRGGVARGPAADDHELARARRASSRVEADLADLVLSACPPGTTTWTWSSTSLADQRARHGAGHREQSPRHVGLVLAHDPIGDLVARSRDPRARRWCRSAPCRAAGRDVSTISARARRSSIWRMRASIMPCLSLAASYSAFSEMSPCSRARRIASEIAGRSTPFSRRSSSVSMLVTLSGHVHFLRSAPSSGSRLAGQGWVARKPLSTRGGVGSRPGLRGRLRPPSPRRFDRVHACFRSLRCAGRRCSRSPSLSRAAGCGSKTTRGRAGRPEDPGAPLRGRGSRVRARADRRRGRHAARARRDHAARTRRPDLGAVPRRRRPARGLGRRSAAHAAREGRRAYRLRDRPDGVLYVRSNLLVDQKTPIDLPLLPRAATSRATSPGSRR